jgi:hypothetical protein
VVMAVVVVSVVVGGACSGGCVIGGVVAEIEIVVKTASRLDNINKTPSIHDNQRHKSVPCDPKRTHVARFEFLLAPRGLVVVARVLQDVDHLHPRTQEQA